IRLRQWPTCRQQRSPRSRLRRHQRQKPRRNKFLQASTRGWQRNFRGKRGKSGNGEENIKRRTSNAEGALVAQRTPLNVQRKMQERVRGGSSGGSRTSR